MQLLEAHLQIFTSTHIALEIMGAQQVIAQAIPVHLKEVNIEEYSSPNHWMDHRIQYY